MLTEIYIEALLVDEEVADEVWELWDAGDVDDFVAACAWWWRLLRCRHSLIHHSLCHSTPFQRQRCERFVHLLALCFVEAVDKRDCVWVCFDPALDLITHRGRDTVALDPHRLSLATTITWRL